MATRKLTQMVIDGITYDIKDNSMTTNINEIAAVLYRGLKHGFHPYPGSASSLNNAAHPETLNTDYVYYSISYGGNSYKQIAYHNGTEWVNLKDPTGNNVTLDTLAGKTDYGLPDINITESLASGDTLNLADNEITWEQGSIQGQYGYKLDSTTTIRSTTLRYYPGEMLIISVDPGYQFAVRGWLKDYIPAADTTEERAKNVFGYHTSFITSSLIIIDQEELYLKGNTKYLAFCLRKVPDTEPIAVDEASHLHIQRIRGLKSLKEYIDTALPQQSGSRQIIKIGAFNCGKFSYHTTGVDSKTASAFENAWHEMLNENDYDILAISDYKNSFTGNDGTVTTKTADNILFGNSCIKNTYLDNSSSPADGLGVASRINFNFIEKITLPDVSGGSPRKTVAKFSVQVNGKVLYLYVGHFKPGNTYSAARADQYAAVISDARTNGYEYVIIAGDMNAWDVSEYNIFINNGYKICNGGYTGVHPTLRIRNAPDSEDPPIPADNIIYSSNIIEHNFKLGLDSDLILNTDHLPIFATLELI